MNLATVESVSNKTLMPTAAELAGYHHERYGDVSKHGWRVQLRHQHNYYTPNMIYQFVVDRLVSASTDWLDVGGGKTVFPENDRLARELSGRCNHLMGVDPCENIHLNDIVHQRAQAFIEDFNPNRQYDLATFRMVAEHIPNPEETVAALDRLIKPGGHAVIYTPNKWSPVAIIAGLTPFWLHPPLVKLLSNTTEEDVFPTTYKMNTRGELRSLFQAAAFEEVAFAHLDNTATFERFAPLLAGELRLHKILNTLGLPYPENAILGVYQKPTKHKPTIDEGNRSSKIDVPILVGTKANIGAL